MFVEIHAYEAWTCSGVQRLARLVNCTTSEKKIVTLSNDSGDTDWPNLSLSATCLKIICITQALQGSSIVTNIR